MSSDHAYLRGLEAGMSNATTTEGKKKIYRLAERGIHNDPAGHAKSIFAEAALKHAPSTAANRTEVPSTSTSSQSAHGDKSTTQSNREGIERWLTESADSVPPEDAIKLVRTDQASQGA